MLAQIEYQNAIEDAMAQCMREQGFEYIPAHADGSRRVQSLGLDLSPERYAERFGFGIAGGFIASVRPVAGRPGGQRDQLSDLAADELDAYLVALEGPGILDHDGSGIIEIGGCRASAIENVEAPPWMQERDWIETASRLLLDRLAADPRMVAIEDEWAECMAAEGFRSLISKRLLLDALLEEFDEILMRLVPAQRFDGSAHFLDTLDDDSRRLIEDFQAEETRLAVASHKCEAVHADEMAAIADEIAEVVVANGLDPS